MENFGNFPAFNFSRQEFREMSQMYRCGVHLQFFALLQLDEWIKIPFGDNKTFLNVFLYLEFSGISTEMLYCFLFSGCKGFPELPLPSGGVSSENSFLGALLNGNSFDFEISMN